MARNCSSRPQWSHLEYRWTLENFWELRALASIDALEDESVIWSPRFGDVKNGLWRLKVYPYGDSSAVGKGHVSVFLALDTTAAATTKTYAIFACYVLDAKGNKVQGSGRSFTRQKFVEGSASWGWSRFIHADDQGFSGLLVNDTLTIKCDIDIFTGIKSSPSTNLPISITLRDELVEYLKRDAAKSVILKIDKTKITINETLLCARSLTFRALLAASTMPIPGEVQDFNHPQETVTPATTETTTAGSEGSVCENQDNVEETQLVSSSNMRMAKKTSIVVPKPMLQTTLNPWFSDPKEFAKVQVIQPFDEEATSSDLVHNTVVLHLTHPEITPNAAREMACYMLNDTSPIFNDKSPAVLRILEVFIISTVYNVQSLRNACIELLISRITSKSDAKIIMAVANRYNCDTLIDECRSFFQYLTPELQGTELVSLLLSTTAAPSSSRNNNNNNSHPLTPSSISPRHFSSSGTDSSRALNAKEITSFL